MAAPYEAPPAPAPPGPQVTVSEPVPVVAGIADSYVWEKEGETGGDEEFEEVLEVLAVQSQAAPGLRALETRLEGGV